MKKNSFVYALFGFGVLALGFTALAVGCGQLSSSSSYSQPTGNYTISGKLSSLSALSIKASDSLTITHIIAISADSTKYKADYNATTGSFSVKVNKGMPYALGFYNQSGGKITLLGYLRQNDFNWHSLPLIAPTGESTDLGSVEVNATSVEAVPSVSLADLLSQVNMDTAAANLYGRVDGLMGIFTNVDVNGDGIFDYDQGKAYMLQISIGTDLGSSTGILTGEVAKMLNQYNDTYSPTPNQYQIIFHAIDALNPTDGTWGTIKFPTMIYGANGTGRAYLSGEVWGASSGHVWNFMATSNTENLAQAELVTPEVIPSGSYTFEVSGKGTYTFQNVKGSTIAAIGTTEGLIYPIFKIATNEAGYVTTIYYKWMIKAAGVTREATAAEVKATIVDTAMNSNNGNLIEASPSIGIVVGTYPGPSSDPNYKAPLKLDRDANSVDASSWNVKFSDIAMFSSSYKINSNLSLSFMFGK